MVSWFVMRHIFVRARRRHYCDLWFRDQAEAFLCLQIIRNLENLLGRTPDGKRIRFERNDWVKRKR